MSDFLKTVGVPLVHILSETLQIPLKDAVSSVALGIKDYINRDSDLGKTEDDENKVEKDEKKKVKSSKTNEKKSEKKSEKGRKKKENSDNKKECEYIFQRSPKKGVKCTSKVDKTSERYCSKHIKKDNDKVKPVVEKKEKVVEVIKTQKRVKVQELKGLIKDFVEKQKESPFIRVERNKYGNYQCVDEKIKNLLIDPQTLEIFGKQTDDGRIQELSKLDVEKCKELGYLFKIPLNLSDGKNNNFEKDDDENAVDIHNEETDDDCEMYEESECESDA